MRPKANGSVRGAVDLRCPVGPPAHCAVDDAADACGAAGAGAVAPGATAGEVSCGSWPPARTITAAIVTNAISRAATIRNRSRRFTGYLRPECDLLDERAPRKVASRRGGATPPREKLTICGGRTPPP